MIREKAKYLALKDVNLPQLEIVTREMYPKITASNRILSLGIANIENGAKEKCQLILMYRKLVTNICIVEFSSLKSLSEKPGMSEKINKTKGRPGISNEVSGTVSEHVTNIKKISIYKSIFPVV